jgi:endo-1,4-beta-xylanase
MRDHIHTVVGRYKGRIKGWDVINETFEDNGDLRYFSPFVRIIGEDFIPLAFQFAHEADPDAELYYNDYSMFLPGRRDAVVKMIRSLKEKGIRIDAVGMQAHYGMDYPEISEVEKSIQAFIAEGVNVMITEFDLSALPSAESQSANISDTEEYQASLNPYVDGLPEDVSAAWNARMQDFFELFLKYQDNITRVTMWGLTDGESWKNGFPIRGRTDYPLLYDRNHQPKPVVEWIQNLK